ncbi:unnamed protein product [Ectocarpus sp. 4 AP-2014]
MMIAFTASLKVVHAEQTPYSPVTVTLIITRTFHETQLIRRWQKRSEAQNLEPWQGRGGEGEQDCTEQLVLFDSLTASLSEVFGSANAPSSAVATVAAAVASPRPRAEMSLVEGDHLYHCIQHTKKFHPDFDQVMKGVLQRDPAAKILLTAGSEVHLPRWGRTLGSDLVEHLVFLPHLPHAEMLLVVAHCKVMLDTFPWGGGVTSLEALLAGVPVRNPSCRWLLARY